ncbi:MAG: HAMP domain-containing histidine kinase [Bacteroidales bacterium]|nr:HAMP domain-containing histidine kinase [Bacteroidales bacterium]
MEIYIYIAIAVVVAVSAYFIGRYLAFRKSAERINYLMDAIQDGEMNFHFSSNDQISKALNRFKEIINKIRQENESESWSKLIRVLTHEIMNTVTPIAALSESLAKNDSLDMKAGLETIAASSKDLIAFVDSYRSLSKLAKPVKRSFMVSEMVEKVIELNATYLEEYGAKCSYRALTPDILLYADEGQISQILINLIKNAAQAESHNIEITAEISGKEEVIIKVINDGRPISVGSKEQIFIPFFTTKTGGSGIGLSLSRQIMRMHNGAIELQQSDDISTTFVLIFN